MTHVHQVQSGITITAIVIRIIHYTYEEGFIMIFEIRSQHIQSGDDSLKSACFASLPV